MKKTIVGQQNVITEKIEKRGACVDEIRKHVDMLEKTINMGDWTNPSDERFVEDQRAQILMKKRKLDEYRDGETQIRQLQARVQQLEDNAEQEVARRIADEKARFEVEKRRHRQAFAVQAAQLRAMMDEVKRSAAGLNIKKIKPDVPSNNDDDDDDDAVVFMGTEQGSCEVEPDNEMVPILLFVTVKLF